MKAAIVNYLNTAPLLYGLTHSAELPDLELVLGVPAACARMLDQREVDLSLLPIGASIGKEIRWIGRYGIGAEGPVRTVVLFSEVPMEQIRHVRLDAHSRTSLLLIRVLDHYYYRAGWTYKQDDQVSNLKTLGAHEGVLMIGDKVFTHEKRFGYRYDLAEEWIRLTNLPFVFAAWAAAVPLDSRFIDRFNRAQEFGVENLEMVVKAYYETRKDTRINLMEYLQKNISYELTEKKWEGIRLFRDLAGRLIRTGHDK